MFKILLLLALTSCAKLNLNGMKDKSGKDPKTSNLASFGKRDVVEVTRKVNSDGSVTERTSKGSEFYFEKDKKAEFNIDVKVKDKDFVKISGSGSKKT